MGIVHLICVLINFRMLGRLYRQLEKMFPGWIDDLWNSQSVMHKVDLVLGPAVFAKRAMLLNLVVAQPQNLPPVIMGDDIVSSLVFKLNRGWTAKIYRMISSLTGYS